MISIFADSFVAAGPFLGVDCHKEERSLKAMSTGTVSGVRFRQDRARLCFQEWGGGVLIAFSK